MPFKIVPVWSPMKVSFHQTYTLEKSQSQLTTVILERPVPVHELPWSAEFTTDSLSLRTWACTARSQ
jgi:hypothetical protein